MKAALIGYGYWGKIVERYIEKHGMELESIYCRNPIEGGKRVERLEDIWEDQKISVVFVCTPIATHFAICKAALLAGKHVFCEKPAVKSIDELRELQECARGKGRIFYTDYLYTVSPSIQYIKENIGMIGSIEKIDASIEQFGNFYPEDDVYEVLGVHLMSAISYVAGIHKGDCDFTHGFRAKLPLSGRIGYRLENGGKVDLYCSLIGNSKVRKIQFTGNRGNAFFSMNTTPNVIIRTWKQDGNSVQTIGVIEKDFDETQGLFYAIKEFMRAIECKDNSHNMDIAVEVQNILEKKDI